MESKDYTQDGTVDLRGQPVLTSKTGKWKACAFLVGYEAFERMAFYGIAANLVVYLTTQLHEDTISSVRNVNNWSGSVWLTPIFGAYIADAYLGRFWTFTLSSLIYVMGMVLLTMSVSIKFWKPTCTNGVCKASSSQTAFFYSALYIVAVGAGGTKPNISTFGADQFDDFNPHEKKLKVSFFNWWMFSSLTGGLVATLGLVYIQENLGWGLGYGVPTVGLIVSLFIFYIGVPTYRHKVRKTKSPGEDMVRVIVNAFANRRVKVPSQPSELHEFGLQHYINCRKRKVHHTPNFSPPPPPIPTTPLSLIATKQTTCKTQLCLQLPKMVHSEDEIGAITNQRTMSLAEKSVKTRSRQVFSEDISNLGFSRNIFELNKLGSNFVANKVTINFDVFEARVKHGIGGKRKGGEIITLRSNISKRTILGLSRTTGHSGLLLGRPRNEIRPKKDTISGCGFAILKGFLDKAAIKEGNPNSSRPPCTVTQVEGTKLILSMFMIWLVTLIPSTIWAQVNTLFVKQGTTLDRRLSSTFQIPAASLGSFVTISMLLSVPMYDRYFIPFMRKRTGNQRGITLLQRLGIGCIIQIIVIAIAYIVEVKRMRVIKVNHVTGSKEIVPMSIFWLLPQYVLLGIADVFNAIGLLEFFYDQSPEDMQSLGTTFFTSGIGVGNFLNSFLVTVVDKITARGGKGKTWIGNNLNDSHLDFYYLFLLVISTLNIGAFLWASKVYVYKRECTEVDKEGFVQMEGQTLATSPLKV
ncbi:unnamed protein product [Camellia sinensis]